MARRGQFGRSPRPAASLTNTIVSIAREMQSQRDQNIVDAWQKGGMFEGNKVTDQMILAHWKARAAAVDKKDPLYDTYNNAFMEYDYSIHESIMRTAYAQGKVNDQTAAAFYLNWSKKVPKNSEFWRVLQRDAAQFTQNAKAKSDAAAKQAAEIKYNNDLKVINDKEVAPGQYLTDLFTNLAKRGLRPSGGDPLIDPQNGQLYQFDASDVEEMLGMITRLSDHENPHAGGNRLGSAVSPTNNVLYHDDSGKAITGQDVMNQIKKLSPGFTGALTLSNLYGMLDKQRQGLVKQQQIAEQTGHLTDAKRFADAAATTAEIGRQVKAWPVEQNYLMARENMLRITNDPKSSAMDVKNATEDYRSYLKKLANDPSVATNDVFRNKMIGEANGNTETTTLAEDFSGLNAKQPAEVAKSQATYDRAVSGIEAVNSGQAVWTTGEIKDGVFVPLAGGSVVGAATRQDIANHSGGIPTTTIFMPDKGGRYAPVAVMGQNITARSVGPDGSELPIKDGANPVVGTVYAMPDGSKQVSYQDGKGHTLWSDISKAPWGAGASLTEGKSGFTLNIPAPTSSAALANSGFEVVTKNNQSVLVYDPKMAMLSTDQTHKNAILNGGGDPHTDFRSPNVSYYANSVEGYKRLPDLMRNPEFQKQVDMDTHISTGSQGALDKDGNIIWSGGDQNELNRATLQNHGTLDPNTDTWQAAVAAQDRSVPAASLAPDQRFEGGAIMGGAAQAAPSYMGFPGQAPATPLATSQLSGTDFGKMVDHLNPGTLTARPEVNAFTGFNIKLGEGIKVPNAPVGNTTPNFSMPTIGGTSVAPTAGATVGGGGVNPTNPTPSQYVRPGQASVAS